MTKLFELLQFSSYDVGPGELITLLEKELRFPSNVSTRVSNLLTNRVRGLIVENGYVDKDYKDLFSAHYSRVFPEHSKFAMRIHAFLTPISHEAFLNLCVCGDSYIGFFVYYYAGIPNIGRTIVDPGKLGLSAKIMLATYRANIAGSELAVNGFPYIQQDTNVMRCAHASI